MTYNLKGFVKVDALTNNNVGINSPIGEPSTWSLTYTRERGEYSNPTYVGYTLVSVSSSDTVTGKKPVDPSYADHVLEVVKWVVDYAVTKGGLIVDTELRDDLLAEFPSSINNLNYGTLVSNGTISLPGFLSWINPQLPSNLLKIWFADNSFKQQYDQFEIIVIPPIANLNDFFLGPNSVKVKVNERTYPEMIDLIQAAKGNDPETAVRVNSYDYNNAAYPDFTFPTLWGTLIYGLAGDNIDAIKDATIAYVLANSTHTREEWTAILPDLFKRTEFLLIPRWDQYAIPNLTIQAGIYSPIINLKEGAIFTKAKVPGYPTPHIDEYLDTFGVPYRSLAILSISNPDNLLNRFNINDIFPDYINSGTTTLDFNRMSLVTQLWASMINEMLIVAESATDFSDIPITMRRVKRDQRLYIAKVYGNIQYLIMTKQTVTSTTITGPVV